MAVKGSWGCASTATAVAAVTLGVALAGALLMAEDGGAVLQPVEAAGGYRCPRRDALDRCLLLIAGERGDILDGYRAVRLDDVDEGLGAVVLHRSGRNQDGVLEGLFEETRVDELVGKQAERLVVEAGAKLDRTGGGVDLIVHRVQPAGLDLLVVGAIVSIDLERATDLQLGLNGRQIVLGDVEDDRDRLQLCDHNQGRAGAREDGVAGIDQAQTDLARDGRDDVAVGELDLVIVHGALVGLDGALVLQDDLLLIFELLAGDGILRERDLVALEVDSGLGQNGLIVLQGALGLLQRGFVGAGIDVDERLPLADDLAFAVVHRHDLAGDLAVDGDRVDRRDGTQSVDINVDVAGARLAGGDRRGSLLSATATRTRRRAAFGGGAGSLRALAVAQEEDQQYQNDSHGHPDPRVALMLMLESLFLGVLLHEGLADVATVGVGVMRRKRLT